MCYILQVSSIVGVLSIIGLTYLSSRTETSDLKMQIESLRSTVSNLQYNVNSLQTEQPKFLNFRHLNFLASSHTGYSLPYFFCKFS